VTKGKTDGKDANKIIGIPEQLDDCLFHTPLLAILATLLPLKGSSGIQEGQMSVRKSILLVEKNPLIQDVKSKKYSVEDVKLSRSSLREEEEVQEGLNDMEVSV